MHWSSVKRILRYLQGTLDHGVIFQSSQQLKLVSYANADWGSSVDDRRSTSGHIVYFVGNPISWSSKTQPVVALSATEAGYRSTANAVSDLSWIQSLLEELQVETAGTPIILCDNSSAVAMSSNPVFHA